MFRFLSGSVILLVALSGVSSCSVQPPSDQALDDTQSQVLRTDRVGRFGVGSAASAEQIAAWDIDVRPDGVGLPVGAGSVEDGESLYESQCAECHGSFGEGVGRYPVLAGGEGTLTDDRPGKTVGSYWRYTSTLYDYIYRAMPFTQPESLSVDEVYAVTAYVLYLNDLVEDDLVLTNENLATIRLPNEPSFVSDPRPDVANERCMGDCRYGEPLVIHSQVSAPVVTLTQLQTPDHVAAQVPGADTYEQFCSICHKVGVGGAPVLGDEIAWVSRLEPGIEGVIGNAINGMSSSTGIMPPKGGFVQLSDEQVADAVRYMVGELP